MADTQINNNQISESITMAAGALGSWSLSRGSLCTVSGAICGSRKSDKSGNDRTSKRIIQKVYESKKKYTD